MTTTETTRTHDTFRMTEAPAGWCCTGTHLVGDDEKECWGGLLQYEVHRVDGDRWEATYKAACQRASHRSAETTRIQSIGHYPGVTFVDESSEHHRRFPLLIHRRESEPTSEPPAPSPTTVDLPTLTDLQRHVLQYLLGGDGTVGLRHQAFASLAEEGAFHPGIRDEIVTRYLEELVTHNPMGACPEGLARFRAEFGLSPGPQRWHADLVQAGTSVRVASVSWICETDDPEEAESFFVGQQALGDIDTHLRTSLYELDGGEHQLDFASHFDVVLADIEHLGPVD